MYPEQWNWDEEHWDAYNDLEIGVSGQLFDSLVDAVELLARGARLNADEREAWKKKSEQLLKKQYQLVKQISET